MRKGVVFMVMVTAIAGVWMQNGLPIQDVTSRVFGPATFAAADKSRAKVDVVAHALMKAESLENIESEYSNLKTSDLERQLAASQSVLQSRGLIGKSNQGLLTSEEAVVLLTEIRRQHVLNTLIAKEKVEQLKRRYL
jgi:hypothetical protein